MKKITCGIFIVNTVGAILTCHPTGHNPTQWDIPKGCGEPNELPMETLARELEEETGLVLANLTGELYNVSEQCGYFEYKHGRKALHAFVLFLDDNSQIDIATLKCTSFVQAPTPFPEVDAFTWMVWSELKLLHPTQQCALEAIADIYGKYRFNHIPIASAGLLDYIAVSKSEAYG